jgi:phage shock protein B
MRGSPDGQTRCKYGFPGSETMRLLFTLLLAFLGLLLLVAVVSTLVAIFLPNLLASGAVVRSAHGGGITMSVFPVAVIVMLGLMGIGIAWAAAFAVRKPTRQEKQIDGEETQIVQEVYRGLTNMEKRIESLETILLDRARESRGDARFRD